MKGQHFHIFTFIFVMIVASPVFAQYENNPGSDYKELNQYPEHTPGMDDKPLIYEHERSSTRYHDSVHMAAPKTMVISNTKARTAEPAKPSTANNEDDALSFNFLYYIIQKFKISDLIDE